MIRTRTAELWHAAEHSEKIQLLQNMVIRGLVPHAEFLDEEPEVLDACARELGWEGVWVTTVDAAGQSDRDHGILPSDKVGRLRKRTLIAKAA